MRIPAGESFCPDAGLRRRRPEPSTLLLFCAAQEIGDAAGEGDNREVFQPKDGTPTSLVSVLTP